MASRARVSFPEMAPQRARVDSLEREGLTLGSASRTSAEHDSLKRIAQILAATNILFAVFIVTIVVVATITANRLADSVRDIAETLGPQTVASIVNRMENTLESGMRSAHNVEHLTESSGEMGEYLLEAMNNTVKLISLGNAMASRMLTHPSLHVVLGDMPSVTPTD